MSQRTKVVGPRTSTIWLLIVIAIVIVAGVAFGVFVLLPQRDAAQHYQAGLALESAEEWEAARQEYVQVIAVDAAYKDAQTRLADVKTRLAEATAQAQAQASATAGAALTGTAEVLEQRYQRALGLINLEQWLEAQEELEAIFETDPSYKDIQAQLALVNAELAQLTPTATSTPLSTATPSPSPTPEGPSIKWIGFPGDQVSPSTSNPGPDGNSDGAFELILHDIGKTITHIILWSADSNYRQGSEHWDTDGGESWILGIVDAESGERLERVGQPLNLSVDVAKRLHCYASVSRSGFRPGQHYLMIVTFADGYSLTLKIRIP